ncbi:hypothetical protein GGR56DRAFT_665620 [Xylariaceae sp. FL0804]|nr:hypothetical protein GGR56DRAFT_665620 [Xylariaceae sp. FL0804]
MAPTTSNALSVSAQREVDLMWQEVENKVIEMAGGKKPQVLDLDSVMRVVDQVQQADKKKSEKYGTFKGIIHRTLQCINTVGGIVANGASQVFAPAGMCYNALTFVIKAWQGYEGIFANLSELLEKCVEFLDRFGLYAGHMDAKLAHLACQNLQLFVDVCEHCIKLRQKHNKLFAFAKQLFLNDDGIQDILGTMDRLNSKESLLVNAQTYKIVSESAEDIKLIGDTQKEQKREDDAKKWRRSIAKALGFPGTSLDTDGEPVPTWQKAFELRLNALVEDTGLWWQNDPDCSQWTRAAYPGRRLLVLGGQGGTGKTSMMANAVRMTRKMGRDGPTTRLVTAYYFSEGDKRKLDDEGQRDILESVSRTLLWQVATSYEAMTKSVASIVERASGRFNGAIDLWDQLFLSNKESRNPETTFSLFIDGMDGTLTPLLRRLCMTAGDQKTRVLITSRPDMMVDTLSQAESSHFRIVPIADRNGDDVSKYITYRMDRMPILRDTTRPGIAEWRKRILDQLRAKGNGDFFKLNNSLSALAKVDLVEDIEVVLQDADKTRVDQIDTEIQSLNNNRTLKEIQEINEIMLWIDTGRWFFSVDTMEALLSVKHRSHLPPASGSTDALSPVTKEQLDPTGAVVATPDNSPTPSAMLTISLLPFSQKLMDKYPIFTITDSGVVDWHSSEIKGRIPKKGADFTDSINEIAGPQVVQQSEIEIVRHFLHSVCPKDLYSRLGLETFLDNKAGARLKDYISLDPENAHIRISLTCLTILTDERLRSNSSLRRYAMRWLLEHMKEVDLSAADRKLKVQVGPLLIRLLTEECGIDSMFWAFDPNVSMKTWDSGEYTYLHEARSEWLYSSAGTQQIARWLQDSTVTKGITTEPGLSFVAAAKLPRANLHEAFLSHAAKHMANHLFFRIEFLKRQFLTACCFLRGYLARVDRDRSSSMPDVPSAYDEEHLDTFVRWEGRSFSLQQLKEIEDWAGKVLEGLKNTPAQQSLWEIHGALITFQLCKDDGVEDIYQRRAREALNLNPRNWHACHFIASRNNTTNEEAVDLLSRAKQAVEDATTEAEISAGNRANSSLLARITLDLGDRLWRLGGKDALAARTHQESLRYDYVHFSSYARVLAAYRNRQCWAEFLDFIRALNNNRGVWEAYFDELVNEFVIDMIFRDPEVLAQAADKTGGWDEIRTFFSLGIDIGIKQKAYDLLFLLREGFAQTLASATNNAFEDEAVAVRVAALASIRSHPGSTLSRHAVVAVASSLAETYLDKAFRPDTTQEAAESYGALIAALLPDTDDVRDVSMNANTVCCLVRYHHRRRTRSNEAARSWTRILVRTGLELLSDEDEENDDSAYALLARLLTAVEDVENTRIAWCMRNVIQHEAQRKYEEAVVASLTKNPQEDASAAAPKNGSSEQQQQQPENHRPLPAHTSRADSYPRVMRLALRESTRSPVRRAAEESRSRPSSSSRRSDSSSRVAGADVPKEIIGNSSNNNSSNNRSDRSLSPAPSVVAGSSSDGGTVAVALAPEQQYPPTPPERPSWLASCGAGCGRRWDVVGDDGPLFTCADCGGATQLCVDCHALLLLQPCAGGGAGGVGGGAAATRHAFVKIPAWRAERFVGMPAGGSVALPEEGVGDGEGEGKGKGKGRRWMPLEEWKGALRRRYLQDE